MIIEIDYTKAGHYKSEKWLAMEEKQRINEGKITRWRAATGGCYEVKRGRLYIDGQPIYKWKGWGLGEGLTYYEKGRGKYKKSIGTRSDFYEVYLKKIMKPYKIPVLKR